MTTNTFHLAYQGLNDKQRQAVDTIYGPLMVIAGPGTGKTQLLTTRVGNILSKTDYLPNNILCITFTTSGVAAMKKRLVELIGAQGNEVEVYTFHSFAEKIIQRYKRYNELEEYHFIDELDQKIILRELLEKVEFNTPLKKTVSSVNASIDFLQNFIRYVKKEKYDIQKLLYSYEEEKISKRESKEFYYVRNTGNFKSGDFKQKDWQEFLNKLDKHIQACHLYQEYISIIESKKLIDYDDLILKAIELLTTNDDLRYDFQEQFQFILVDEFQDTNGAQLELMNQLCRENEEPNIMVVGDEDQSIFRFQGANLYNIFDFKQRYLSNYSIDDQLSRIVVLEKNYRSTPIILESSRELIRHNAERITNIVEGRVIPKVLEAAHPKLKNVSIPAEFIVVNNSLDEYIPIALEIEKLVTTGVQFRDIAVLFPTNNQMVEFSKYLQILSYPYELSKNENLLEDPTILSYIDVFEFIINFRDRKYIASSDLSKILFYPYFNLSLLQISQFWAELKENKIQDGIELIEYIEKYEGIEAIVSTFDKIKRCLFAYSQYQPERYFHFVLETLGVKDWAISQIKKLELFQKIEVLGEFLKNYLTKDTQIDFENCIERVKAYIRESISIPYIQRIQNEESIQLMTYHKSKGLEFEYVFVKGAGRTFKSNAIKLYIPIVVIQKDLSDSLETKRSEEEKRRLLYVAMTRAKRKLFLTDIAIEKETSTSKNIFKSQLPIVPSDVYENTKDIGALIIEKKYSIQEKDYLRFETIQQEKLMIYQSQLFENEYVKKKIQSLSLSHSSISLYLECPEKFYFDKIVQVPSGSSQAMISGDFYHKVLENYFKLSKQQGEFVSKEVLMDIARKYIFKYRNLFSEIEFKDIQQAFESNLPMLFEQYLSKLKFNKFEIEEPYTTQINHTTVKGFIDKIDYIDSYMSIVDFKTSKFSNSKKKLKPYDGSKDIFKDMSVDEQYGGSYWRQAMLYHLLAKKNNPSATLLSSQYVFIVPENDKIETIDFQSDEAGEEFIVQLIQQVYENILAKKFDPCRKKDCDWCSRRAYIEEFNQIQEK